MSYVSSVPLPSKLPETSERDVDAYRGELTFHVIQGVPQHFKHGHIHGVTEGPVEQVYAWVLLQ